MATTLCVDFLLYHILQFPLLLLINIVIPILIVCHSSILEVILRLGLVNAATEEQPVSVSYKIIAFILSHNFW